MNDFRVRLLRLQIPLKDRLAWRLTIQITPFFWDLLPVHDRTISNIYRWLCVEVEYLHRIMR